ncbi:MAG TPA: hypothetical protein VLW65_03385 [Bryobacteraceae bacterium]|nr:hypothetical protein [Bryobacteraceae bacterium]
MKLADLRRLSIRRQTRIRFPIRNGMECVITEHGIAQVPGLRVVPDFNLEQELAVASAFVLEPVAAPSSRQVGREQLDAMVASAGPGAAPEHEED